VFAKTAASAQRVLIWHPRIDGVRAILGSQPALLIGGGTTGGMLAIGLTYALGYRHLHLFGFDSSFDAATSNQNEPAIQVNVGGRSFATSATLAQQVNEFRMLLKQLVPQGLQMTLHGDGLLPYVMEKVSQLKSRAS
jgi:hypothetical protein